MAHHIIPEIPGFNGEIRKFETTDRNHADVFNRPIAALIENDHFLKKQMEEKANKEETNKIYTAAELSQKTLQNAQMYFVKVQKGQTLEQIGQYSIFKENSGQVTSLKGGTQTDKVYSVYYDSTKNGFFMRASATGTAAAEHVLANKTFSSEADTDQIGTMPNRGTWNATLTSDGQVIIPDGYHNGAGKVKAHTVSGRTIVPGRTEQTAIEAGKLASGDIKISGDSNLHAGNIRHGSNIFGVNGNFTADATVESGNILEGRVAYARGQRIVGTLPWRGNQTQGITPGRQTQRVNILNGIHQGGGYVDVYGDSDLQAGNIRQGVNIFGVQGTAKTDYSAEQAMIANALTNKGVPTPTNTSFSQMAENIQNGLSKKPFSIDFRTLNEDYFSGCGRTGTNSIWKKGRVDFRKGDQTWSSNLTGVRIGETSFYNIIVFKTPLNLSGFDRMYIITSRDGINSEHYLTPFPEILQYFPNRESFGWNNPSAYHPKKNNRSILAHDSLRFGLDISGLQGNYYLVFESSSEIYANIYEIILI